MFIYESGETEIAYLCVVSIFNFESVFWPENVYTFKRLYVYHNYLGRYA